VKIQIDDPGKPAGFDESRPCGVKMLYGKTGHERRRPQARWTKRTCGPLEREGAVSRRHGARAKGEPPDGRKTASGEIHAFIHVPSGARAARFYDHAAVGNSDGVDRKVQGKRRAAGVRLARR
jgi:hypothetical protein